MLRYDRIGICLAVSATLAIGILVFGQTESPPTSAPASQPAKFKPAFAAMDYFDTNCARCHGPQGSFYGKEFGKHLSDATLTQFVRDMADGPGNAPLKPDELPIVVAYHRSLISGEPFISVTSNENGMLKGEVSPGSKVLVDGKPAQVDGSVWTGPKGSEIMAMREKKSTVLRLPAAYSHRDAIGEKK